jgi:hypothetical protein
MPLSINTLRIQSWSNSVVVVCGSMAILTSERYVVDIVTKTVQGAVGPRNGDGCPATIDKRMNLVDGRARTFPKTKRTVD